MYKIYHALGSIYSGFKNFIFDFIILIENGDKPCLK